MSGQEEARATADKIRKENEEKAESEVNARKDAENQLAVIGKDAELAKLYSENAKVGAENLAGELPLLKVQQEGKSSKNELADGSAPSDGYFYYKPTMEQFKEIECHVLTISRGFWAPGLNQGQDVFTQLLAGVILDGKDYKPFIMYFTGKKLSGLWDFGKAANKYTHAKPIAIPMFALRVKMTTRQETNNYSYSWLVDFEILKNEDRTPVLITDQGRFTYIRDNVELVKETIEKIIASKTSETKAAEGGEPVRPGATQAESDGGDNPSGDIPF